MKEIKAVQQVKSREAIIGYLIYSPLFDGLNAEELEVIANHVKFFELEKDGILFKEGVRGDSVCFVIDGEMDIIKESSPGESVVIASLSKGGSIGEMAIIDKFPRSATAKARTKTSFLTLTRKSFDTLLKEYPQIGIEILKRIARLLSINLRKTSSRLADYMLPLT